MLHVCTHTASSCLTRFTLVCVLRTFYLTRSRTRDRTPGSDHTVCLFHSPPRITRYSLFAGFTHAFGSFWFSRFAHSPGLHTTGSLGSHASHLVTFWILFCLVHFRISRLPGCWIVLRFSFLVPGSFASHWISLGSLAPFHSFLHRLVHHVCVRLRAAWFAALHLSFMDRTRLPLDLISFAFGSFCASFIYHSAPHAYTARFRSFVCMVLAPAFAFFHGSSRISRGSHFHAFCLDRFTFTLVHVYHCTFCLCVFCISSPFWITHTHAPRFFSFHAQFVCTLTHSTFTFCARTPLFWFFTHTGSRAHKRTFLRLVGSFWIVSRVFFHAVWSDRFTSGSHSLDHLTFSLSGFCVFFCGLTRCVRFRFLHVPGSCSAFTHTRTHRTLTRARGFALGWFTFGFPGWSALWIFVFGWSRSRSFLCVRITHFRLRSLRFAWSFAYTHVYSHVLHFFARHTWIVFTFTHSSAPHCTHSRTPGSFSRSHHSSHRLVRGSLDRFARIISFSGSRTFALHTRAYCCAHCLRSFAQFTLFIVFVSVSLFYHGSRCRLSRSRSPGSAAFSHLTHTGSGLHFCTHTGFTFYGSRIRIVFVRFLVLHSLFTHLDHAPGSRAFSRTHTHSRISFSFVAWIRLDRFHVFVFFHFLSDLSFSGFRLRSPLCAHLDRTHRTHLHVSDHTVPLLRSGSDPAFYVVCTRHAVYSSFLYALDHIRSRTSGLLDHARVCTHLVLRTLLTFTSRTFTFAVTFPGSFTSRGSGFTHVSRCTRLGCVRADRSARTLVALADLASFTRGSWIWIWIVAMVRSLRTSFAVAPPRISDPLLHSHSFLVHCTHCTRIDPRSLRALFFAWICSRFASRTSGSRVLRITRFHWISRLRLARSRRLLASRMVRLPGSRTFYWLRTFTALWICTHVLRVCGCARASVAFSSLARFTWFAGSRSDHFHSLWIFAVFGLLARVLVALAFYSAVAVPRSPLSLFTRCVYTSLLDRFAAPHSRISSLPLLCCVHRARVRLPHSLDLDHSFCATASCALCRGSGSLCVCALFYSRLQFVLVRGSDLHSDLFTHSLFHGFALASHLVLHSLDRISHGSFTALTRMVFMVHVWFVLRLLVLFISLDRSRLVYGFHVLRAYG